MEDLRIAFVLIGRNGGVRVCRFFVDLERMSWRFEHMTDDSASALFQEARALIQMEQPFKALPLLKAAIERSPDFGEAYVVRARLRRRLNDLEGAIADYSKAIKLTPTVDLYLARALAWLGLGKAEGAVGDARRAVAIDDSLAGGHRLLGKALGLLGDGVGATEAYKRAARCYLDMKDKENAALCLKRIEGLRSLPPLTEEKRQAISGSGGVRMVAVDATPETFLRVLRQKYEQKQYREVLKDTEWLLQMDAENAEALSLRGLVCAQMGQAQRAVEDLARATQLAPDSTAVHFDRARMRLALSDGAGAVEDLSVLIDTVGGEARFFAQRATAYQSIGSLESAFKDYANALAVAPEDAELYQQRAEVQQKMGEKSGAVEDYQRAATLWLGEGKWAEHQQVVEKVRQLRAQLSFGVGSATFERRSSVSVPIKSYQNHLPVVEVSFDGIATFDIVVDRNATHSIVTQQMAQRLNLELVSYRYVYLADGVPMELPIARLRSVAIGGLVVTDVYVAVAPDKETAVLGKDCFGVYKVRISGNEMTFAR